MKRLLLAAAALAFAASAATADTGTCLDLADPDGDQNGSPTNAAAVPVPVEDLDLLGVNASATTAAVSATFSLASAPDPAPATNYEYWLELSDDTYVYRLTADIVGAGLTLRPGSPYVLLVGTRSVGGGGGGGQATVESWTNHPVTGSVDAVAGRVTVTADASLFGSPAVGDEIVVTGASTHAGALGGSMAKVDVVAGPHTLVVGAGC